MAELTLSAALCEQLGFAVRVCQLRLLAVVARCRGFTYGGSTTKYTGGTIRGPVETWLQLGTLWPLQALPGELYRTFQTWRQCHRRYTAPQLPKLKLLR